MLLMEKLRSGMLMGWESVTSFFSSFLYLNVLCGLEHFA